VSCFNPYLNRSLKVWKMGHLFTTFKFISLRGLCIKTELIEHIAKNADISKAAATYALESTINAVNYAQKAMKCLATVHLWLANVLPAPGATHALAKRLKSRPPVPVFVQAKPERRFELTGHLKY
jgi:hypothetical protein